MSMARLYVALEAGLNSPDGSANAAPLGEGQF